MEPGVLIQVSLKNLEKLEGIKLCGGPGSIGSLGSSVGRALIYSKGVVGTGFDLSSDPTTFFLFLLSSNVLMPDSYVFKS